MNTRIFLVDVEASAPSPASGVMTEFGVVEFETRHWFHGHLWDFKPTPGAPALPIPTEENCGYTATSEKYAVFNGERQDIVDDTVNVLTVYSMFLLWLESFGQGERKVFVSDNPGFDFQWISYGFDSVGMDNPFGHSSRRIGDFAAGLAGKWNQQTKWKSLRETRHTHNPVDDAMGNAEALAALLARERKPFNPMDLDVPKPVTR